MRRTRRERIVRDACRASKGAVHARAGTVGGRITTFRPTPAAVPIRPRPAHARGGDRVDPPPRLLELGHTLSAPLRLPARRALVAGVGLDPRRGSHGAARPLRLAAGAGG